ncbi:heavy-metal-associated domain-containing protein [Flaviaesturariibacter terrae]
MKKVFSFLAILILVCFASAAFAQVKKETINVSGECGMCKKTIEAAAKKGGASFASWNVDTKVLTVRYDAKSSNTAKIQQSVAAAGYDSPGYRASDEAYNKLHACCQYERAGAAAPASCCDSGKCKQTACMKDGKCAPDMSCCKEGGCAEKDCCKKDERHAAAAPQKGCCAPAAACCAPKAACCARS